MYSRNYGFSNDTPAKINIPPSYAGSVISRPVPAAPQQEEEVCVHRIADEAEPMSTSPINEAKETHREEKEEAHCCAPRERMHPSHDKKEKGLLSGIFSGMSTEDLILLGIIAALALGLFDSDLLLVALVVAVVLM